MTHTHSLTPRHTHTYHCVTDKLFIVTDTPTYRSVACTRVVNIGKSQPAKNRNLSRLMSNVSRLNWSSECNSVYCFSTVFTLVQQQEVHSTCLPRNLPHIYIYPFSISFSHDPEAVFFGGEVPKQGALCIGLSEWSPMQSVRCTLITNLSRRVPVNIEQPFCL